MGANKQTQRQIVVFMLSFVLGVAAVVRAEPLGRAGAGADGGGPDLDPGIVGSWSPAGVNISNLVSIPLTRHKSQRWLALEDRIAGRRGSPEMASVVKKPVLLDLYNDNDLNYIGKISIGTPAKPFSVLIDTASTNLWVYGPGCEHISPGREGGGPCSEIVPETYDPAASTSDTSTGASFSSSYGSGSVTGVVYKDVVQLESLKIFVQGFGMVTQSSVYAGFVFNGLLGLDQRSAPGNQIVTFLTNLGNTAQVEPLIFSMYLKDQPTGGTGSKLIFGGPDPTYYWGCITYTPLVPGNFYSINLEGVSSGGSPVACIDGCTAIVDSGKALISLPEPDLTSIVTLTSASDPDLDGIYTVPCASVATLPVIHISINSKLFSLKGDQYTRQVESTCLLGFIQGDSWILGDVWMRAYYTIFDVENNQLGFATAVV